MGWRPSSPAVIKRFEIIQRRATKWIYSESFVRYEDDDYLLKLKKLDILPIGFKFLYTDLVFFHRIFYGKLCITLPSYLSLVIPDPDQYTSRLRNRIEIIQNNVHPIFQCTLNAVNQDPNDPLLLKCNLKPRTQVNDNTFFIRTYKEWNKLPLSIRIEENFNSFETRLKNYIWELLKDKLGRELWPD